MYFHGGVPGLYPGDMIRPPSETGAGSQAEYGNRLADPTKVYVTTRLQVAALMAGSWRVRSGGVPGDVYEVEPQGELEHDPGLPRLPGESFTTSSAQIIRVVPIREWHPSTWSQPAPAGGGRP